MSKWKALTDEESKLAVKAFNGAVPGVFGVAEAIDEMLRTLANLGIIERAGSATKG